MNIHQQSSSIGDHEYTERSIIIKRTKQMGLNRLNSVQKATNLKKDQKWE